MRALVTYGSERGGTAGLAEMLATALRARGMEVDALPVADVGSLDAYDLVVVGGALYANRWHRDARRFVRRRGRELRGRPVWLFSSGPLGDENQAPDIPPVRHVAACARRVGARGHATFGGALAPDARGVMAHSLARRLAGDWRNPADVYRWAAEIVGELTAQATSNAAQRP